MNNKKNLYVSIVLLLLSILGFWKSIPYLVNRPLINNLIIDPPIGNPNYIPPSELENLWSQHSNEIILVIAILSLILSVVLFAKYRFKK
jgi:hypothetical protein